MYHCHVIDIAQRQFVGVQNLPRKEFGMIRNDSSDEPGHRKILRAALLFSEKAQIFLNFILGIITSCHFV